jgi:hypothetical protein
MMEIIHLLVLIASAIWLTRMFTRIAVASETTAIIVSHFYALLPPEKRAAADQYLKDLKAKK